MDKVQSRDASADPKRISTLQPVGVTAEAGKQLVIYASIPPGAGILEIEGAARMSWIWQNLLQVKRKERSIRLRMRPAMQITGSM